MRHDCSCEGVFLSISAGNTMWRAVLRGVPNFELRNFGAGLEAAGCANSVVGLLQYPPPIEALSPAIYLKPQTSGLTAFPVKYSTLANSWAGFNAIARTKLSIPVLMQKYVSNDHCNLEAPQSPVFKIGLRPVAIYSSSCSLKKQYGVVILKGT